MMRKLNFFKSSLMILLMCLGLTSAWGQATLPISRTTWNTTPTGWTDNGTLRDSNFACTGSNGGSLQSTGKYYMVYFDGTPDQLTYSLKTGGISGNSKLEVQESPDGNSWTNVADYQNVTYNACQEETKQLSSSTRYVRFYYTKGTGNMDIDDVSISQGTPSTDLTLSVNPTELSGFSYVDGNGPSAVQTFELTGTNLDDEYALISLVPGTNFEISENGIDYNYELDIVDYNGEPKPIYVRLKAGLSVGNYTDEISIFPDYADEINVSLEGSVTAYSTTCGVETFTNMPDNTSSYGNRTWTGDNDISWTATEARTDQELDGRAIALNDGGELQNTSVINGVGTVTFEYARVFNGNSMLRLYVNDEQYGEDIIVSSESSTEISIDVNVEGNAVIRLENSGNRTIIDNFSWTCVSNEPCFSDVPTAESTQTLCAGSTVADLEATGQNIKWYDDEDGEPLDEDEELVAGTYYVSQTTGLCDESEKVEVEVIINAIPSAPTVNTPITYTYGDTAEQLTATATDGNSLLWYETETGGSGSETAPTPLTNAVGEQSYWVSQIGEGGCESQRVEIVVNVEKAPLTVTATDESKVFGATDPELTYTVTGLVNGDTAADALTGALSREAGEDVGTYDITQGTLDAENYDITFVDADFEITEATLEDILSFEDDTFYRDCNEHSIFITGSLPDGVIVTYTGNAQSEVGGYTVIANIDGGNNYEDLTLDAEMTIVEVVPEADPYSSCGAFAVEEIAVDNLPEGWQAKWYATATSSTALDTIEASGTYYVAATIDGCESERVSVDITITNVNVPTGATEQPFCNFATIDDLIVNHTAGSTLNFYDEDGTLLNAGAELHNGTYYVTEAINNCESGQLTIEVTITTVDAPTVEEENQQFCGSATVADLMAEGENIQWYDSQDATTPLANDATLSTGIYFVSQTTNGCESERVAVNVMAEPAPEALSPQTITSCGFTVLSDAEVGQQPNTELLWYINENDTAPIDGNSQVSTGTHTYYASQRIGICESERVAITFVVTAVLPQPTASSQTFCGSAVVSDLVVHGEEGALFWWYDSATSEEPLAGDQALSNGTYYVSQSLGACESARKAISVQIVNTTAPQIDDMYLCEGTTIGDVNIPAATGITYKWYANPTVITPLSANTVLTDGTYYISSSYNGCESERVAVDIETAPVPDAPTGETEQSFVYNISTNEITLSDLVVNEDNVLWFAHEEDIPTLTNPLLDYMPLENGRTYYAVIVSDAGCVSNPLAVTVTVTLGNERFDRAQLAYYPNPTQGVLNIRYTDTIEKVEIYNTIGQLVATQEFNSNQVMVDMHQLSNGTYLLKLHIDGQQQFIKVIKK